MKSLRKSTNEHCKQCIYDPLSGGTWRQQVEACTAPNCALFEVRPKSRPRKIKEHEDLGKRMMENTW